MKQTIDISDELYSIFKKHGIMAFDYLNEYDKDNLARIIANGTPYNPQGDLISREALKAKFKRSANSVRNWKEGALNEGNDESAIRADAVLAYLTEVKGIIDNAQAVEPFTQLEKEEIADAINYLLGAELLEENGYTEEVINALKSALKKVGGAE